MANYGMQQSPGSGRKRPPPGFGPSGGRDDGQRKKGRFEGGDGDPAAAPPATLRILIRQQDAGGLIGKGGENIKKLRKKHDCQVLLPDSPGSPERVMTMMGRIDSCVGVLLECLPKLGEGVMHHGEPDATFEVQVLVPQPFMGTIIGTGGTKIKELRTRTKCSIKIFSEPMPNSNERSVQMVGSEQQINDCVQYFLEEISKKDLREPIFLYEPSPDHDMFMGPPMAGGFSSPPRQRGQSFRGGRDGGKNFGGGGRGGRNGGKGRSFSGGGWKDRDHERRGPPQRGGPSYQQHPPSHHHRPSLMPPQPAVPSAPPSLMPPAGPPNLFPPASQMSSLMSQAPPSQGHSLSSNSPSQPPLMGSGGYSQPPPAQMSGGGGGGHYGGGGGGGGHASVGYSSSSSSAAGQGQGQMYMPSQNPASMGQPSDMYKTQQVTIPSEYTMSIVGPNGSNLNHIKGQSSCEIVINEPQPGSHERIITITGIPSNIQIAQTLMQNSVRQYHSV